MKILLRSAILCILFIGCTKTPQEYVVLGKIKAGEKNIQGAVEDFTKAIELDSNYSKAYFERSKYSENTYQAEDLKKYIELEMPDMITALAGYGMVHRLNENYDEAIEYFEKAIFLDPDFIQAYGLKREALEAKGDTVQESIFVNSLPENIQKSIMRETK